MKALITHLLQFVGHWLHGINNDQFQKILDYVTSAASLPNTSGADKFQWVKDQIAGYLATEDGKALLGKLSGAAVNWLIESAVGLLLHK